MKSLGFLGLVFDTGLSVTPLMGHLGYLASHWSVPVKHSLSRQALLPDFHTPSISVGMKSLRTFPLITIKKEHSRVYLPSFQ